MVLARGVDDEGEVLDLLVQRRRDKAAAMELMRKLLKKDGFAPDLRVADKLRSYGAAKSEMRLTAMSRAYPGTIGPRIRTSQFDGANARCSASSQRFLSVHAAVHTFNVQRHLTSLRRLCVLRDEVPYVANGHCGLSPNRAFKSSRGQIQFVRQRPTGPSTTG